jgi:beta-glucanase (GH16 family)
VGGVEAAESHGWALAAALIEPRLYITRMDYRLDGGLDSGLSAPRFPARGLGLALGLVLSLGFAPSFADGWKWSWSDEFNGAAIETATWGYEIGYKRNDEAQYYSNRPENARLDSGHLLIRALRDNWQGHEYTAASLNTSGKKSFQYGKFEIRARIDVRQGSWPAWWWLPNSGGWPKGGEIDMMEFYQNKCLFNVMDGNQKWTSKTQTITSLGGTRWAESFHVWTMVWDAERIDLYLDGALMNHYDVSLANGTGPNGANPFQRPGYFLLNQALGGTNGGDHTKAAYPIDFRVDWIRMHTWSDEPGYQLTVTGGMGTDTYVEGTAVSLVANMPAEGQQFERWQIETGEAQIENATSSNTRLTMGKGPVAVRAIFIKAGTSLVLQAKRGRVSAFPTRGMPTTWDLLKRAWGLR